MRRGRAPAHRMLKARCGGAPDIRRELGRQRVDIYGQLPVGAVEPMGLWPLLGSEFVPATLWRPVRHAERHIEARRLQRPRVLAVCSDRAVYSGRLHGMTRKIAECNPSMAVFLPLANRLHNESHGQPIRLDTPRCVQRSPKHVPPHHQRCTTESSRVAAAEQCTRLSAELLEQEGAAFGEAKRFVYPRCPPQISVSLGTQAVLSAASRLDARLVAQAVDFERRRARFRSEVLRRAPIRNARLHPTRLLSPSTHIVTQHDC